MCWAGMPAAPKTPSQMPRLRPNANAPTAPSLTWARTDELDESLGRVRLEDDLGEEGRVNRAASGRPVIQDGHIEDGDQLALGCKERNRAANANVDRYDGGGSSALFLAW